MQKNVNRETSFLIRRGSPCTTCSVMGRCRLIGVEERDLDTMDHTSGTIVMPHVRRFMSWVHVHAIAASAVGDKIHSTKLCPRIIASVK